jgi:nitroreductase
MTTNNPKLSLFSDLVSVPAAELVEPAPDGAQLQSILQAAMSAPDHGSLRPYRFIVIRGDARGRLSEVFADAATQRGLDQAGIDKQRAKPLRSPLIVSVVARIEHRPKIPEIEQLLSAGCAAQHIQLACRLLGFGSIWLTGDNCYDQTVYRALGLDLDERLVGFLYIGTPAQPPAKKIRPPASDRTEIWVEPQVTDYAI